MPETSCWTEHFWPTGQKHCQLLTQIAARAEDDQVYPILYIHVLGQNNDFSDCSCLEDDLFFWLLIAFQCTNNWICRQWFFNLLSGVRDFFGFMLFSDCKICCLWLWRVLIHWGSRPFVRSLTFTIICKFLWHRFVEQVVAPQGRSALCRCDALPP